MESLQQWTSTLGQGRFAPVPSRQGYCENSSRSNKVAREIHGARNTSVRVNYLPGVAAEEVVFICWTDAAVANRKDLSSTGGHVVAATSPAMLHGEPAPLTLVAWRSHKLQRIARSSLSAEIQAFSEGEEELMYVRLCGPNCVAMTWTPRTFLSR